MFWKNGNCFYRTTSGRRCHRRVLFLAYSVQTFGLMGTLRPKAFSDCAGVLCAGAPFLYWLVMKHSADPTNILATVLIGRGRLCSP